MNSIFNLGTKKIDFFEQTITFTSLYEKKGYDYSKPEY